MELELELEPESQLRPKQQLIQFARNASNLRVCGKATALCSPSPLSVFGSKDFHTPKKELKKKRAAGRGDGDGETCRGHGARVSRSRKVQSEWQSAVRNALAEIIVK